jgi:hypothetical protein
VVGGAHTRRQPWLTYRELILTLFLTAGLLKTEPWLAADPGRYA